MKSQRSSPIEREAEVRVKVVFGDALCCWLFNGDASMSQECSSLQKLAHPSRNRSTKKIGKQIKKGTKKRSLSHEKKVEQKNGEK